MTIDSQPTAIGNHKINLAIGIVGMLLASFGNLLMQQPVLQKECYFIGAILLLVSSLLERQAFFIGLQIILVVGTGIAFASFGNGIKAGIPITLSVLVVAYFAKRGWLQDGLTLFGCFGIALLAAGYAITHPVIYLLGSLNLMVYAFLSYRRGITVAMLWAVLNAVFAVTASIGVYRMFVG